MSHGEERGRETTRASPLRGVANAAIHLTGARAAAEARPTNEAIAAVMQEAVEDDTRRCKEDFEKDVLFLIQDGGPMHERRAAAVVHHCFTQLGMKGGPAEARG